MATVAMCAAVTFGAVDPAFPTIPVMEKPMNQMTKEELKAFYAKRKAAIEALPPPYLKQLGVIPYIESTYRKACREGWAPAPTNDVQKAIWEDINATKERGPANALPIPSPKKK